MGSIAVYIFFTICYSCFTALLPDTAVSLLGLCLQTIFSFKSLVMKKIMQPTLALLLIFPIISCRHSNKEKEEALLRSFGKNDDAGNSVRYELSLPESQINWKGTHITGGGHGGTLQFDSGYVFVNQAGKITGGRFAIDMNSMHITEDTKGDKDKEEGLRAIEDHLKSEDFFTVNEFPGAYFEILQTDTAASAARYPVTGNLIIKGIARLIRFDAATIVNDSIAYATATIPIDRTRWGIIYEAQGIIGVLKNGTIANEISTELQLVFRK